MNGIKADLQLCNNPANNLLARADVTGRTMRLFGFTLFKKKDGTGFFVSPPSRKSGEKWVPIVEIFDKRTKEAIETAIITAYQEALSNVPNDGAAADDPGF